MSRHRGLAPSSCSTALPAVPYVEKAPKAEGWTNAKHILDADGPEAVAGWVKQSKKVCDMWGWFGGLYLYDMSIVFYTGWFVGKVGRWSTVAI